MPELNDAFIAEKFKGSNTVAEFKTRVKDELERRFNVALIRSETDKALKALEGSAQFFLSESFIDQKVDDFLKSRNIDKAELNAPQITNIRNALSEQEKPNLLMRQLINDAEKFHQKKTKTEETYIQAFKRFVREEILRFETETERAEALLTELDRAIDAMVEGASNQSPWESLISSYLTVFSRDFLFNYFDDEGIVKKGKKMTYKELAGTLAQSPVDLGANG